MTKRYGANGQIYIGRELEQIEQTENLIQETDPKPIKINWEDVNAESDCA
jgi:hypothetical protein